MAQINIKITQEQKEEIARVAKEKKISEQEGQDKENGKISKKFIWPTKHDLKTILKKNDTVKVRILAVGVKHIIVELYGKEHLNKFGGWFNYSNFVGEIVKGTAIELDVVRESLKDVLAIRARTISVENIQRVVSEYFRIPLKELVGPKRTRIYARPRQLAMGLARELTGDSFPEIGMAFGGRDHSTVMHACEKVASLREQDPIFNEDYKNLLRLLQS